MRNTIVAAALLALCASATAQDGVEVKDGDYSLKIPKKSYQPGEAIELSWTTAKDLHKSAWLGVIPADAPHGKASVNDRHDVAYTYVSGKTTGSASPGFASHSHTQRGVNSTTGSGGGNAQASISVNNTNVGATASDGSGSSHDHTLSLDLQYVDLIIATKD